MSWQHISTLCPKGYPNQHGHAVSLRVTEPRQQHDKASSRARPAQMSAARDSVTEQSVDHWHRINVSAQYISRNWNEWFVFISVWAEHMELNRVLLCDTHIRHTGTFFLVPKYNQMTNSSISFWVGLLIEHHNWCILKWQEMQYRPKSGRRGF